MQKKEKFIYWLIGVGCGIVLSGIVMTFISLSIVDAGLKEKWDKPVAVETLQYTEEPKEYVVEETEDVQIYKWVDIPFMYNATQISALLKEEGIVDDEKKFLEYIREHQKTTSLRCGMQYLPVLGKYDIILAILTGKI